MWFLILEMAENRCGRAGTELTKQDWKENAAKCSC